MIAERSLSLASLKEIEARIEKGIHSFMDVAHALMEIRDRELYLAHYVTFEDYCQGRWNFSRQRAYQLIESTLAADAVSTTVDIASPPNERVARELAKVNGDGAKLEVWQEAVATAPHVNGKPKVTAKHVAKVAESNGHATKPKKHPKRPEVVELNKAEASLGDAARRLLNVHKNLAPAHQLYEKIYAHLQGALDGIKEYQKKVR